MRLKIVLCLFVFFAGPKAILFAESFDEVFIRGAKLHYQCRIIETRDHNLIDEYEKMCLWYFKGYVTGQDELFSGIFSFSYPGNTNRWNNGDMWDIVAIYSINHPEIIDADRLFENAIVEKDPKFRELITKTWAFNMPKK